MGSVGCVGVDASIDVDASGAAAGFVRATADAAPMLRSSSSAANSVSGSLTSSFDAAFAAFAAFAATGVAGVVPNGSGGAAFVGSSVCGRARSKDLTP
jgi:hypothetical protein